MIAPRTGKWKDFPLKPGNEEQPVSDVVFTHPTFPASADFVAPNSYGL